jgi:2-dehydropantoate 2-reductase
MGTGAVGGYFGARMMAAGIDVRFVARGENLAALKRRGLVVRIPTGDIVLPDVRATDDPGAVGPVDFVLVAVKSYHTENAAGALRPAIGPRTIVLSLQNGIENEDILARVLDLPPLPLALTQIGAALTAPGEVQYYGRGSLVFGEPHGEVTPRLQAIAACLTRAAIPYRISRRMRVRLWDKLAWNAAFNAVSTLGRRTVAGLLDDPAARRLIADTMTEVAAVARAQGIACDPARVPAVLDDSRATLGPFKTSMLQDLERGRRLEHDALNGAVVRAADRVGAPAPINRALATLLGMLSPV